MSQISITAQVSRLFEMSELENKIREKGGQDKEISHNSVVKAWSINGITLILYEKSLVIQAPQSDNNMKIISEIINITGLSINDKSQKILSSAIAKQQNAIVCNDCQKPSFTIVANMEDPLQVRFRKECTHEDFERSSIYCKQ